MCTTYNVQYGKYFQGGFIGDSEQRKGMGIKLKEERHANFLRAFTETTLYYMVCLLK